MLNWRSGMPEESGQYLALYVNEVGCAHIIETSFSTVHKMWNCHDSSSRAQAEKNHIEGVRLWAPLEAIIPGGFEYYTKY